MVILLKLNSLRLKKDKKCMQLLRRKTRKLNNLIPDIKDYINEYEMEFGKP